MAVSRRAADRNRLRRQLRRVIAVKAPALHAGQANAGLEQEALTEMVQELIAQNQKRGLVWLRGMLRILDTELRRLQRVTGGAVALPDIPVTIQRQRSPFTPDRAAHVRAIGHLESLFAKSIAEKPVVEAHVGASRILLSAILYGGLVHGSLVEALPDAINCRVFTAKELLWCDLTLDPGTENARVRRWFPDPITQCLILNWKRAAQTWPDDTARNMVWKLVRVLTRHECIEPMSWSHLLAAVQTRLRIDLPAVLVDFLASTTAGQSLPARAWWRIIDNYHLESNVRSANCGIHFIDAHAEAIRAPRYPAAHRDDLEALKDLNRSLKMPSAEAMRKPADAIRALHATAASIQCRPLVRSLFDWAVWMLRGGSGYQFRTSSVARYLNAFGKLLLAAGGEIEPDSHQDTGEHLEALYETVLESAHAKQRNMAAIGLRHYHTFLRATFDAPPVAIDDQVHDAARVNANTISEQELERIQELLRARKNSDDREKEMLCVIALLFYRLGLRRSELAWLRLSDVQYQVDAKISRPVLWVHAHPAASLKTYSSTRRLPLAHLLNKTEQSLFGQWLRRRQRELQKQRTSRSLIFCERGRDSERLSDTTLDLVVDAARVVCGDPQLVLHSFRHAFASNLFASLIHAEWLQAVPEQDQREVDRILPWRDTPTETTIVRRHFFADTLPRGAMYLISSHAGHVDPTESTRTYIHYQDFLAYLYLRERQAHHPNRLWAALEGISEAALKVRHSRHRGRAKDECRARVMPHLDTPARLLKKAALSRPPGKVVGPEIALAFKPPEQTNPLAGLSLDAAYRILSLSNTTLTEKSRTFITGVDVDFSRRLWRAATSLARRRTSTRNRQARRRKHLVDHAREQWPDLIKKPQLDRLAPALPRRHAELTLARTVFSHAIAKEGQEILKALIDLLDRTSRTDRGLNFTNLDRLTNAINDLHALGIGLNQMQVRILSMPASAPTASAWRAAVRRRLKRRVAVELHSSKRTPISRGSARDGRLSLRIMLDGRQSSGWRVGSYYAACVIAARDQVDIRALAVCGTSNIQ